MRGTWINPRLGLAIAASLALVTATAGAGDGEPLDASVRIDKLIAYKSERRLEAYSGSRLVRTYRIAIGSGGAGPKQYEGDRRTPEGTYRIDRRHRSRRYHRFLHVSYPNAEDRRRYRELRARGEVPEGAGIGSAIGIHGQSRDPAERALGPDTNWTAGCIAVSDEEIEELYRAVVPNALLEIRP